jgi:hypothetical protein
MSFAKLIPVMTLLGDWAVQTTEFKVPKQVGDPANTTALLSSSEGEEWITRDAPNHSSLSRQAIRL